MKRFKAAFENLGARLILLVCIAFPVIVLASDKQYPMEGTVTALGTTQETTGGGGTTPVSTNSYRTYTVKTPTRVFVFECPYWINGFHIHSPSECGGRNKLQIGDALHFRIEKHHAYISIDKGKEQKLRILSEAVNETGTPEPAKR